MSEGEAESIEVAGRFKVLRIWIPAVLLVLMVVCRYIPGMVNDGPPMLWMVAAFGPMLLSFLVLLWWVALSRATVLERVVGFFLVPAAFMLILQLLDPTMFGPAIMVLTFPMGVAAFALVLIAGSRMLSAKRTWIAVACAFLGFGFSTLLKSDGMWGNFALGLDWRWTPTPEEVFLAEKAASKSEPTAPVNQDAFATAIANPDWSDFRGPARDGVNHGTRLLTDWDAQAPEELWRISVGPAWSSFTVAGSWLFTQEQRGEFETVVCYDAADGSEVWVQSIESRFWDALGGLGPRATPTIADGSLFVTGAEGWLMRLDARDGSIQWKVDLKEVAGREAPPMWGFSSSPLVTHDSVVVHAGGKGGKGILAFEPSSGELRWQAEAGHDSYGSLQVVNVADRELLAILTNTGVHLLEPADGQIALDYKWTHQGYRALQPNVIDGNGLLIPTGMGTGTRLVRVTEEDGKLQAEEEWTSRNMKPDYNDLVVHEGYMYGFDGSIFACVDLKDGSRRWKRGRYGKGQVLLLADSDVLLVASETGEVVLVATNPEEHQELAKFQAVEGKTWNHPVVIGDRLYVRSANEAACYRLPMSKTLDEPVGSQ